MPPKSRRRPQADNSQEVVKLAPSADLTNGWDLTRLALEDKDAGRRRPKPPGGPERKWQDDSPKKFLRAARKA